MKFSPKRLSLFEALKKDIVVNSGEAPTSNLRSLCPTRWTVRHSAINAVLDNYKILQNVLEKVEEGHDEYAVKAHGLLLKMESFDMYFGLKLAYLIFSAGEQLSINLQAKSTTVQEAIHGANLLHAHFKSQRTESKFDFFYNQAIAKVSSELLNEEPKLPQQRKLPTRLDQGGNPHQYQTPKDRYRHLYFEALEQATGEIERRFQQSDLHIINKLETLLLNAGNGKETSPIPEVRSNFLASSIDMDHLKIQLPMLYDMITTAYDGTDIAIKKVTNVRTIADVLQQSEIYGNFLSEINKAVKLYFTFPVTSATAERSFSSLRKIKTFLRSTMTPCRLNNLFILYIHTAKTDDLDLLTIARHFVSVNSRRLNYFGSF